jgi:gas vesicle protein
MADRDGSGFLWFLAGLGVGAVVGVLYAPRSGDEMRDVIRSKAQEGSERAREQARRAREQANEWVDRGAMCSISRKSSSAPLTRRDARHITRRPRLGVNRPRISSGGSGRL